MFILSSKKKDLSNFLLNSLWPNSQTIHIDAQKHAN